MYSTRRNRISNIIAASAQSGIASIYALSTVVAWQNGHKVRATILGGFTAFNILWAGNLVRDTLDEWNDPGFEEDEDDEEYDELDKQSLHVPNRDMDNLTRLSLAHSIVGNQDILGPLSKEEEEFVAPYRDGLPGDHTFLDAPPVDLLAPYREWGIIRGPMDGGL